MDSKTGYRPKKLANGPANTEGFMIRIAQNRHSDSCYQSLPIVFFTTETENSCAFPTSPLTHITTALTAAELISNMKGNHEGLY